MSTLQDLLSEIKVLQKQADAMRVSERKAAIKEINSLIEAYGILPSQLSFSTNPISSASKVPSGKGRSSTIKKSSSRSRKKVSPKYAYQGSYWSGRGKKPRWVVEYLTGGGSLEGIRLGASESPRQD